jgi:hypothetical protein
MPGLLFLTRHHICVYASFAARVVSLSHYAQLASAQPKASMPEREAVSDNVVIAFIRQMLTSSPNAKHSALLRVFREGGHACEQKRFRSLYQDVFRSN